ncbi:MAG TPA: BamA/TamA family outer membrane protein [Bryobacteraceae bacterium]|nr:BamA/TamA family outer membrane protein [Bryobacteraceae bacterium]
MGSSAVPSCLALPFLALAACASLPAGQALFRAAAESNVNQRYTIESVSVAGIQAEQAKLPPTLRKRLTALVGERCDVAALEDLASDLRKELHLREVNQHLLKGSQPDRIRVNFEIVKKTVDIAVPKFLYHSQQGWTGEIDASTQVRENTFTLGAVSNADDLVERFTGVVARYENTKLGSDKLRFGLGFEDYHEQWSRAAASTTPPPSGFDFYRARRNIAPEITFAIAKTMTLSAGMSFEQMESETPATPSRSANAVTGEIRYGRKIEGDAIQQTVDGKYDLRVATRSLGSDYSYSRHMVSLRYEIRSGRQTASDELFTGTLAGNAPLFERFLLGNSSTLRGWNRDGIDPLGGDRVVHNSLTYGYQFGERTAELFYDSGAIWNAGHASPLRHSLGVGYRQGIFILTMAFPVIEGRIAPVFMAGMNY